MRNALRLLCSPSLFVLIALLPYTAVSQDLDRVFLLSFPGIKVGDAERVVGFRCTVAPGRILSLREFPDEWQVTVQNGDSETANIRGQVLIGAGAFSDASFFQDFLKVKLAGTSAASAALQITGELQITTDDTFEHYRYVKFGRSEIKLREVPGGNASEDRKHPRRFTGR